MGSSARVRSIQRFAGPFVIGLPFRMRATAGVYHISGSNYKSLRQSGTDEAISGRATSRGSSHARDISLSLL